MAYSELIKNLDAIRSYLRDFYVYGFKSRNDYDEKNRRSYDDERRRIESWLGEYMRFRRTAEGKTVFLSIDSRSLSHNPLYQAWKTKSFTDIDITLHFILLDILAVAEIPLPLTEIIARADGYLQAFENPLLLDESTIRKKLKEYADEGLLLVGKEGKKSVYSLSVADINIPQTAVNFYSEIAPCGVVGYFLSEGVSPFTFKHHYITGAIDSEILYKLFLAIGTGRFVKIRSVSQRKKTPKEKKILPLQIFISSQNGRQYAMSWCPQTKEIVAYRLDYIIEVTEMELCAEFSLYRARLEEEKKYAWGVMFRRDGKREHISFTLQLERGEEYIYRRLLREKRCGEVEEAGENRYRFSAEVYDVNEMIPWIRTFIGRIIEFKSSQPKVAERFKRDLNATYRMYGIEEDSHVV